MKIVKVSNSPARHTRNRKLLITSFLTDQIVQSLTDAELGEIMSVALVKRGFERDTADLLIKMSLEFVAHLKKGELCEYIVFSIRDALTYSDYLYNIDYIAFRQSSRRFGS